MSPRPLLQGELVRLAAFDSDMDPDAWAAWQPDSLFYRQLDSSIARPRSPAQIKKDFERADREGFFFTVHTLTENRLIGFISLDGILWAHGTGWVAIGIADANYRGKGFGTDAMRELLRYAFVELGLFRVNLDVFEYNPRAIRSYEKVGFVREGRLPERIYRDGRWWALIFMGILREEWMAEHSQGE